MCENSRIPIKNTVRLYPVRVKGKGTVRTNVKMQKTPAVTGNTLTRVRVKSQSGLHRISSKHG